MKSSKTVVVYTTSFEENLKLLLRYEPDTGFIYYTRGVKGRKRPLSEPAGSVGMGGYIQLTVFNKQLKAHRVAWFLYYGVWPDDQIDHINKNTSDNRIENLRVGGSVNQHNRSVPVAGSGLIGAHKSTKKNFPFCSAIRIDGKSKFLGLFKTAQEAHETYMLEKEKILASK